MLERLPGAPQWTAGCLQIEPIASSLYHSLHSCTSRACSLSHSISIPAGLSKTLIRSLGLLRPCELSAQRSAGISAEASTVGGISARTIWRWSAAGLHSQCLVRSKNQENPEKVSYKKMCHLQPDRRKQEYVQRSQIELK